MKKIVLVVLLSFSAAFSQDFQEVPLMAGMKALAEQQGTGLYNYSLARQAPNTRLYTSEFQTDSGELVRLDWRLKARENKPFLDEIQIATERNPESYATGYALGFSWTNVQIACFGVPQEVTREINVWAQERFSDASPLPTKRRYVKRDGAFEFLLELTPRGVGRSKVTVTMSRDDSPGNAESGWTSYCVHEPT